MKSDFSKFSDYINIICFGYCFLCAVLLKNVKGVEAWRNRNLLISLLLILVSTLVFGFCDDTYNYLQNRPISDANLQTEKNSLMSIVAVWRYLAPVIFGAIGVNLFTSWLQSKKPENL